MRKKILAIIIIIVICIAAVTYYVMYNKNKNSNTMNNNKSASEFKVRSAFADVDLDMTIQDKDIKDDDTSGDYIFINFTNEMADNKKNDDSNPVCLKSYTFDNNSLSSDTKIYIKDKRQIIIKLKDGTLKGLNAPHLITISKNLLDEQGNKIKGQVALKLPYSNSITDNSSSDSGNKGNDNSSSGSGGSNNASGNNSDTNKESSNTDNSTSTQNADLPEYTVELGKAVPYTTIVMVKLNTANPENYKVSIEGNELQLRENSEGQKVFIAAIKKVYELDQAKQLIKIEKVQ